MRLYGSRDRPLDLSASRGLRAAPLQIATGLPVLVSNDVNTLAVAEQWSGYGRGSKSFAVSPGELVSAADWSGGPTAYRGQLFCR